MELPIIIDWLSPLSFSGSDFEFLFHFSIKFLQANRIAPDGMPHSAVSPLGLFCLPMSHKKDARLIRVKTISLGLLQFFQNKGAKLGEDFNCTKGGSFSIFHHQT